jgi:hypothetical protein
MVAALFSACQEVEIDEYENDPRLYFYRDVLATGQRDSLSYSFFLQGPTVMRDTIFIFIRTMGLPSPEARPFRMMQANAGDSTAAQAGVHYLPFDSAAEIMYVPARAIDAYMPVIVLRDTSLKTKEMRLEITIAENEYFKPGIQDNTKFTLKLTDFAVMPASWSTWGIFFQTWGPQKMLFLTKSLGIDFNEPAPREFDVLMYYGGWAKDLLKKYNDEHPDDPLKEDDGTLVTFD